MSWPSVLELVQEYSAWLCFLTAGLLALLLRLTASVWRKMRPTARQTVWVVEGLRLFSWLALLAGVALGAHLLTWPAGLQEIVVPVLTASAILLVARTTVRVLTATWQRFWARWFPTLPVTTLTNFIIGLVVYIVAGLMVLHQFGLSITPLLTAVGVGGLAVALGVQDTLTNLFAGISITLAQLFRPGDYLRLENGMEGTVLDIGWRYTTLRTPQHTLIVIPNQRLSQLIVTNLSLPDTRTLVHITVTLPPSAQPVQQLSALEQSLREAVAEIPEALPDLPPILQIAGLTDKAQAQVQLKIWLRNPQVQHEAVDTVYRRLIAFLQASQPGTA